MEWKKLLSPVRFGKENIKDSAIELARSEFQRDYDRLIFSSPFRRLQNKTQVFPLPGSVFVHNRLTHSLEVASVGRSLGDAVAFKLGKTVNNPNLLSPIGTIVSTASLSHDMGNPPFGHSGESSISNFFACNEGQKYKDLVSPQQWTDLVHFEGNANALRLLTHQFNGRRQGGFALTYATLASLIKYPFASDVATTKGKFGFFNSEKDSFLKIVKALGIKCLDEEKQIYARHPLVYLVEAADDISYQIMDLEDAHRLKILSTERTQQILLQFFDKQKDKAFFNKKEEVFKQVTDSNEQVAFLRASVINLLTYQVADAFVNNIDDILSGTFEGSIIKQIDEVPLKAMKNCAKISVPEIYNHRSVVEIEITGNNVINTLLKEFCEAMINPPTDYSQKILSLLPLQFKGSYTNDYDKLRSVVDFVSGMTDLYAVDLYKLIKGN